MERIIGKYDSGKSGPMLIFIGGIHGNEPAGIEALQCVFNALENHKPIIKGSVIGLAGNPKALEQKRRFLDIDLNRIWLEEDNGEGSEFQDRKELVDILSTELSSHLDEVIFFDLHTTSSQSEPFIFMSDTLRNRRIAEVADIPVVLGIQEQLLGTMMDITTRSGFPTIIFEGGGTNDPETALNLEGLVWKMLLHYNKIDTSSIKESLHPLETIDRFNNDYYEVFEKYVIKKDSVFKMLPGFKNFQPVKRGEKLATLDDMSVNSNSTGLIFMPLYQKDGNEGFFIARKILKFWIGFSSQLRKFNFHKRLHWLLGVYKTESHPLSYKIDQRIAFLWATEVFHLLGYRKNYQDGPWLYMIRRENEKNPPTNEQAIKNFHSLIRNLNY